MVKVIKSVPVRWAWLAAHKRESRNALCEVWFWRAL